MLEEGEEKPAESEGIKGDESGSHSSVSGSVFEAPDRVIRLRKKPQRKNKVLQKRTLNARKWKWMTGCLSLLKFSAHMLVLI